MSITTKHKHLTLDERVEIQECLDKGMTFNAIGKRIGKDQTTVSKEVKLHSVIRASSIVHKDKNGQIVGKPCELLMKAPFVCNGCKRAYSACSYDRNVYIAKVAQKQYENTLKSSREGIALNKESFYDIDRVVTECVNNGQHLYHIVRTQNLGVSERTVYRHLHKGYFSISVTDMPRIVKFKPRKGERLEYVPKGLKINRTYADYLQYIEEHEKMAVVEMDTVIGVVGGKVIMTMLFTNCNFMFGKLLPDKTAASVSTAIRELKGQLNECGFSFGNVFPVILTDNGGEFSDVFSVENNGDGECETRLFFCNPLQSNQKAQIEKNHTLFRDIVPKGKSFNEFTQDTVNLIFTHVNNVKRKHLHGKSAYEMFSFIYGKELATCLGINEIPNEQVLQSPKLLVQKQN